MNLRRALELLATAEGLAPRLTGPEADVSLAALEERYDEFVAAIDLFAARDRPDEAQRLAHAMYRYWITQSRFDDGARVFERALAAWPGRAARSRGTARWIVDELARARDPRGTPRGTPSAGVVARMLWAA